VFFIYLFETKDKRGKVIASADVFSSASRTVTLYTLRILARETTLLSGNELTTMKIMIYKKLTHSVTYRVNHKT
jgi:hypothetical protein